MPSPAELASRVSALEERLTLDPSRTASTIRRVLDGDKPPLDERKRTDQRADSLLAAGNPIRRTRTHIQAVRVQLCRHFVKLVHFLTSSHKTFPSMSTTAAYREESRS